MVFSYTHNKKSVSIVSEKKFKDPLSSKLSSCDTDWYHIFIRYRSTQIYTDLHISYKNIEEAKNNTDRSILLI